MSVGNVKSFTSVSQQRRKMSNIYEGTVKLANGPIEKVIVTAANPVSAKQLLEAQYGQGSVLSVYLRS